MSDTAPTPDVSIIIPVYNEAASLGGVLDEIAALPLEAEVIVVDDGSQDGSAAVAQGRLGVHVFQHPYNIGNGAAIKTGIASIAGLRILGDPLWVIAFASDELDIYQVLDHMSERGWSLNVTRKSPCCPATFSTSARVSNRTRGLVRIRLK